VAKPFTDQDLYRWRRSFLFSPQHWVQCGQGHSVDPALQPWKAVKDRRAGWQVQMKCDHASTGVLRGPVKEWESPYFTIHCKSHAVLAIPEDLSLARAPQYPGHATTAWKDGGTVFPRINGVYTCTVQKHRFSNPTKLDDWCVIFNENGQALNFDITHEGYSAKGVTGFEFQLRMALNGRSSSFASSTHPPGPDPYQVKGTVISWYRMNAGGSPTEYTGFLERGGRRIGKIASGNPNDKIKRDFEFRQPRFPPFA
jgi:hypothetical protein